MPRSFKLKIALSSVLLSGLLLAGFGLFFLQTSYQIGLDRSDRELRALVDADMRRSHKSNHWLRFDESLKRLFGESADKQFVLKVSNAQGERLVESPQWTEEIGDAEIPRPGLAEPGFEFPRPPRNLNDGRPPGQSRLMAGKPVYKTVGNWRVMAIRNPEITLELGISLEPLNAEIARFRNALLLAVPIALLLMIGNGWLLARLALRPVNTIARTAKKVTALHLDERIPTAKTDHEFRQLIDIINQMLGRLEGSFQQAVRFSADAAHELKTPLTILQGQLETALQSATDDTTDQRTYKESLDEVQRLKSIIRKLLLLAQADSGHLPLNAELLDFTGMIKNVREDIGILNPEIKVRTEIQPDVAVQGDADLLGQVIQNLAGNAVKFSQGESPITLTLGSDCQHVEFCISNRGATIPEKDRDKIFERFYRADKVRTRKIVGTGLGLSLAREIAHAHGGSLELADSKEGEVTFRLTLPARITEP